MKKFQRMRMSPNEEISNNQNTSTQSLINMSNEPVVRTTGRIKKPKAVFDPSDNNLPRAQRPFHPFSSLERRASTCKSSNISPVGVAESKDACVSCKKKESKRPVFAIRNPLISCSVCQRKIHKLCLKVDFDDFDSVHHSYKCDQCSNCRICNGSFNNPEEEMIICSKCTKCFHFTCFPTKIIKTDNLRNWKCNKCQIYNQVTNGTILPVGKIREIIGGIQPAVQTSSNKLATITVEKNSFETNSNSGNTISTSASIKRPLEEGSKNLTMNSVENADNSTPVAKHAKLSGPSSSDTISTETNSVNTTSMRMEENVDNRSSTPIAKQAKLSNQSADTVRLETTSVHTPSTPDSTNLCFSPNGTFDDIPDVKEWSVEQVYEYFFKHFPKEANIFKEEEIDGPSLLLLKRSDVVRKLPFKLGPSLRIYNVILKIQAQLNDETLGWN